MITIPIKWIRADKYCEISGVSIFTLSELIRDGKIAATKHYKRTGSRTLWVNLEEMDEWVQKQPHVEAAHCPPALKSVKQKTAQACA